MAEGSPGSPAAPVRRGAAPLRQAIDLAPLLRQVAGLALALEAEDPAVDALIGHLAAAQEALRALVPGDPAPRMAAGDAAGGRVYLDHSHDVGAYNPCFPEYEISVRGDHATGTVAFPLAFEGPPGMVHGGILSLFFDLIVQHHNCELGIAGKTTAMSVRYRRPVPRTTSDARLFRGDQVYAAATVEAVAANVSSLPGLAPRRLGRPHAPAWALAHSSPLAATASATGFQSSTVVSRNLMSKLVVSRNSSTSTPSGPAV
jgi:hypothetical protein